MNSLDTEFMKQKEVDSSEWTTRETVEKDTEDENKKCGEILIGYNGAFTFVCILCTKSYRTLASFGLHINSQHIKIEVDSDVADLSPLRVDTFNVSVSTATEKPHPRKSKRLVGKGFSSKNQVPPLAVLNKEESSLDSDDINSHNEGLSHGPKSEIQKAAEAKMINTEITNRSDPNTQTATCKYCDKIFMDAAAFGEHLSSHTGPKRFVCSFCSKTFEHRTLRQAHMNTHMGEKPHKCSYCPKAFARAENMKVHERAHLGIKKYSCDYCDKRFVRANDKRTHERTHTGEKPFQCEECGRRFVTLSQINEHTKRHQNIRNHKCNICAKTFYTAQMLADHTLVHTKERPYTCKVCGQDFPRRRALRTHMQLHSNVKKYVCPLCGKAFAQSAGLYSHKKSHVEKPL